MKWMCLLLTIAASNAGATLIDYQMYGNASQAYGDYSNVGSLSFGFQIDSNTGEVTEADGYFLGQLWTLKNAGPYFVYQQHLEPDNGTLMHWMQATMELSGNGKTLYFFQSMEWKVPYQGEGSNPFENLEKSVTTYGLIKIEEKGFGFMAEFRRAPSAIPEPATLPLLFLGLAAIGIRRRMVTQTPH